MDFKQYLKEKIEKDFELKEQYEKKDLNNLLLDIGNEIERERIKNKIRQSELAKKIKTSQSYISRLENGSLLPSIKALQKIAEALGGFVEIKISYNKNDKHETQNVEQSIYYFDFLSDEIKVKVEVSNKKTKDLLQV